MFRRRPAVGQRGPSLLRTAAVVGTATAVSKGVSGAMDQAAMNKQQEVAQQQSAQSQADLEQVKAQLETMQAQQLQTDQVQAVTAAAPVTQPDFITQLRQLTQLKQAGALSEDEFQAAKAKLLSS